jgi:hypothetical protein
MHFGSPTFQGHGQMHLTHNGCDPTAPTIEREPAPRQWARDAELVFIVGSPRSGTTWLQAMLGSHPAIATGPETHFFRMMGKVSDVFDEKMFRQVGPREYFTPEEFHEALANLFQAMISKVPAPHGPRRLFLEKTPEHCHWASLILRCFPEARFIHLLRDGRHVVHSLIKAREWADGFSATMAARVWKDSVTAARAIPALLANKADYCEVRYEDLRREPREHVKRIFGWLELEIGTAELDTIIAKNELAGARRARTLPSIRRPGSNEASGYTEPAGFFGEGSTDARSFGLTRLQEYQCYRTFGALLHNLGYVDQIPRVPLWATLLSSWKLRHVLRLGQV